MDSSKPTWVSHEPSSPVNEMELSADPAAIQGLSVIPGATDRREIMPFWQAVLGYERRPDSPDEDLGHRQGPVPPCDLSNRPGDPEGWGLPGVRSNVVGMGPGEKGHRQRLDHNAYDQGQPGHCRARGAEDHPEIGHQAESGQAR